MSNPAIPVLCVNRLAPDPRNDFAILMGRWTFDTADDAQWYVDQLVALGALGDSGTGSKWRVGNGVPDNSVGVNGDQYLDGLTSNIYTKGAGVYTITANIAGKGVPVGGTTGQTIVKIDGTDYNAEWTDRNEFVGTVGFTENGFRGTIGTGDGGDIYLTSGGGGIFLATAIAGTVFQIVNGNTVLFNQATFVPMGEVTDFGSAAHPWGRTMSNGFKAVGSPDFTGTGAGCEFIYLAGTTYIQSTDRADDSWKPLVFNTLDFTINPHGGHIFLDLTGKALGDTYYTDASGKLIAVPAATDGQVWTLAGGVPTWADAGGSTRSLIAFVDPAGPLTSLLAAMDANPTFTNFEIGVMTDSTDAAITTDNLMVKGQGMTSSIASSISITRGGSGTSLYEFHDMTLSQLNLFGFHQSDVITIKGSNLEISELFCDGGATVNLEGTFTIETFTGDGANGTTGTTATTVTNGTNGSDGTPGTTGVLPTDGTSATSAPSAGDGGGAVVGGDGGSGQPGRSGCTVSLYGGVRVGVVSVNGGNGGTGGNAANGGTGGNGGNGGAGGSATDDGFGSPVNGANGGAGGDVGSGAGGGVGGSGANGSDAGTIFVDNFCSIFGSFSQTGGSAGTGGAGGIAGGRGVVAGAGGGGGAGVNGGSAGTAGSPGSSDISDGVNGDAGADGAAGSAGGISAATFGVHP